MGFAMKAKTEWKIGGGGGGGGAAHTPAPQPWYKCPHPRTQNAKFGLGLRGGGGQKSVLSSATRLQEI